MIDLSSKKTRNFISILSYIEGASLLILLLIAMPIKYVLGNPSVVSVVGMIHGILFMALVGLVLVVATESKWPKGLLWVALISATVPMGMFYFDKKLKSAFPAES